jgi:hypothetical protein
VHDTTADTSSRIRTTAESERKVDRLAELGKKRNHREGRGDRKPRTLLNLCQFRHPIGTITSVRQLPEQHPAPSYCRDRPDIYTRHRARESETTSTPVSFLLLLPDSPSPMSTNVRDVLYSLPDCSSTGGLQSFET